MNKQNFTPETPRSTSGSLATMASTERWLRMSEQILPLGTYAHTFVSDLDVTDAAMNLSSMSNIKFQNFVLKQASLRLRCQELLLRNHRHLKDGHANFAFRAFTLM